MAMSKKDFIALADAIRTHNRLSANHQLAQLGSELNPGAFTEAQLITLAEFCRDQNSNFKRARWLSYIAGECGPNGGAR